MKPKPLSGGPRSGAGRGARRPASPVSLVLAAGMTALCLAAPGACAVSRIELTPAGAAVQVAERRLDVKGCDFLGLVQGYPGSLMGDIEAEQAISARNKAAAMGGNRIVRRQVPPSNALSVGSWEYEVFACSERPASAASPAEGGAR